MKLVDKVYGYKKAEQYRKNASHNNDELSDESKVIIITTEMLRDLFLFLAAGYGFCSFVFFFELNICRSYCGKTYHKTMSSKNCRRKHKILLIYRKTC